MIISNNEFTWLLYVAWDFVMELYSYTWIPNCPISQKPLLNPRLAMLEFPIYQSGSTSPKYPQAPV